MNKKTIFSVGLAVFLLLSITLIALSKPAVCEDAVTRQTILIQSDGSIYPANVPIQRNGDTYTLTANIYDPILIEKSNIIFDGGRLLAYWAT